MAGGYSDATPRAVKRVAISSNSTSIDLIAAVAADVIGDVAKKIRILSLHLASGGAAAILFNSISTAPATTTLGRHTFKATDPALVLPHNIDGWYETLAGGKFNIGNADAGVLTGLATYVEI